MKTSLFSRDAHAEPTPVRAPAKALRAGRLAAVARAAATATLMLTAATQLSGCFPVIAGAMGAGVMSATDRRPTSIQAVDRGLQLEIENTLATRYSGAARVNVTVFNKKVLLTGEVKDANLRQQIEQYVRGLPNAREVVNELEVVSSPSFAAQSQDAFVTSKVKTMLMTAEGVPSNSTKVTTERGVVYLMGLVTRPEGDRATETARNVGGVSKVVKVFDYIDEAERARLDAAASSQNAAPGEPVGGTPAPVQGTPGTSAPTSSTPAPVGADLSSPATAPTTAPTTAPVPGPVGLPPGRNLP
ncbi:BON domain-containing protein [Cupriavidus gilardii]|uniref:BON domain-containing protein n=1 Tax=Cupriavidus gilardii TaxID=82541 RepID=UPI001ABE368F|nr:BON domain-containing protein [Cupriavidus gilardii]